MSPVYVRERQMRLENINSALKSGHYLHAEDRIISHGWDMHYYELSRTRSRHTRAFVATTVVSIIVTTVAIVAAQPVAAVLGCLILPTSVLGHSLVKRRRMRRTLTGDDRRRQLLADAIDDLGGLENLHAGVLSCSGVCAEVTGAALDREQLTSAEREIIATFTSDGYDGSVADIIAAARTLA